MSLLTQLTIIHLINGDKNTCKAIGLVMHIVKSLSSVMLYTECLSPNQMIGWEPANQMIGWEPAV